MFSRINFQAGLGKNTRFLGWAPASSISITTVVYLFPLQRPCLSELGDRTRMDTASQGVVPESGERQIRGRSMMRPASWRKSRAAAAVRDFDNDGESTCSSTYNSAQLLRWINR